MTPARIDVTTPSRAYTVAIEDDAIARLGGVLDEVRAPKRRFVVSSPLVWRLHGPRLARGRQRRRADSRPRRRTLQTTRHGRPRLRRAGARQRRSRLDADHVRRRRHRRHGRLRRRHLFARHRARPRADHAARAGGQLDRRQGRRQSSARQESDRRLLSAARRRHRSVRRSARCRAGNSAPACTKSSNTA